MGLVFPIFKMPVSFTLFLVMHNTFNKWWDIRQVSYDNFTDWVQDDLALLKEVIRKDYNIDIGPSYYQSGGYAQPIGNNFSNYNVYFTLIDSGTFGDIRLKYKNESSTLSVEKLDVFPP